MKEQNVNEQHLKLPKIADPNIDQVLERFLAEQRQQLKPKTVWRYECVIDLLRDYLNGYGHDGLNAAETALFRTHFDAGGDAHREFCGIFGPDKIVENLGMFLGYFMIRKVIAGAELKRAAGMVTKKLSAWLATNGYIPQEDAAEGSVRGAEAARDLPRAERAAQILADEAGGLSSDPSRLPNKDYLDFDHYTISKIEPGKIWFSLFSIAEQVGPVAVPKAATSLLQTGWSISCSLGRIRGKWRILEVANVYPL